MAMSRRAGSRLDGLKNTRTKVHASPVVWHLRSTFYHWPIIPICVCSTTREPSKSKSQQAYDKERTLDNLAADAQKRPAREFSGSGLPRYSFHRLELYYLKQKARLDLKRYLEFILTCEAPTEEPTTVSVVKLRIGLLVAP